MYLSPTHGRLPHVVTLLDSIPGTDSQKARMLGLSLSTIRKYRRSGTAPRAVLLALFWESPYGSSVISCDLMNEAAIYRRLSRSLDDRCKVLARQVEALQLELAAADGGSANSPFFRVG